MPTTRNTTEALLPAEEMEQGGTWDYKAYKEGIVATLAGLAEYIGGDEVTANDSHAVALLDWLGNYVQDEM